MPDCTNDVRLTGHKARFERGACGNGSERRSDAGNRTIEEVKAFLLNSSCNFGSDTALLDGFVGDD